MIFEKNLLENEAIKTRLRFGDKGYNDIWIPISVMKPCSSNAPSKYNCFNLFNLFFKKNWNKKERLAR